MKPASIPESAYLLGVGGMGMAPLAIFLAQAGCAVSGHDDALQPGMRHLLESHGVKLEQPGHPPDELGAVIFSSAVPAGHDLLTDARTRGLTVLRRGEMLARLSRDFRFIAVAGSHGKTSTTGLIIHLLQQSGMPFHYVLGARFRNDAMAPARFDSEAAWLVAEVDESDGTIEGFSPEVTVLVNFDWDHADRYRSPAELSRVFAGLAQRTTGQIIAPAAVQGLVELPTERTTWVELTSGDFNEANDSVARHAVGFVTGQMPASGLGSFPGVARRQDVLYEGGGVSLIGDYAHHPTEIEALLRMARATRPGRLIAVFQPHRYSRTEAFAGAFAQSLKLADEVLLLPVYGAGEKPTAGGQTGVILQEAGEAWTLLEPAALARTLAENLEGQGGTVLFIGAGDIEGMAARFAADWAQRERLLHGLSAESRITLAEPLAKRTTLRVGGAAHFFAEPASVEDLCALLGNAAGEHMPVFLLGRGSNLIVSDRGFDGLVVALNAPAWQGLELLDDGRLRAGAGIRLKELCGFAAKRGLGGLEFLEGIPGTLGGALRMNAGAMGGWIFDCVESVEFITMDGGVHHWPVSGFHVGYRECAELKEAAAVRAVLRASEPMTDVEVRHRMDTYAQKRKETQPREPSAGCIFKNPPEGHAGKLIDELGLKGCRYGAAEVSRVHGNFMINTGGATCADMLGLVRQVRDAVHRGRGILLEPEVLLLGESWEEVLS